MRLSQITVENHSRISDLQIRVSNHLVIVGANDIRKTSLLRVLNFILGSSTAQMYAALNKTDLRDPARAFVASVQLVDFNADTASYSTEKSTSTRPTKPKV